MKHNRFQIKMSRTNFGAAKILFACLNFFAANVFVGVSTHGMVASVNPIATQAGVNVLKCGGNAIDAAVAVGLTLGGGGHL